MTNKAVNNKAYKQLAEYYDEFANLKVFGVYKTIIGKIKGLRMLDLGCGTGMLLKYYSIKNETIGVDASPEMIKMAKRNDSKSHYSVDDITSFKINKKFNIITCAFDTINHLSTIEEWGRLFERAAIHLEDEGTFIFDFNTIEGFKNNSNHTIYKKIKNDYFTMRVKIEGQICFWLIDCFVRQASGLFKHKEFIIKERSYPNKLIMEKVKKYFIVEAVINEKNRTYIKAKKKTA